MAWTKDCWACSVSFPSDAAGLIALERYLEANPEPSAVQVLKLGGRLEPCQEHRRSDA